MPLSNDRPVPTSYVVTPLLIVVASFATFLLGDRELLMRLGREDGFFETAGALFFLFSSFCFVYLYVRDKSGNDLFFVKTRRNVFYLLLGIMFFFGFGEEISWGQRVFDIRTPEVLEDANLQGEMNIHNLEIFHGRTADGERKTGLSRMVTPARLFSLFWLTFCVLIPVVYRASRPAANFLKRVSIPLVPLAIGSLFLINYGIAKVLAGALPSELIDALSETKEAGAAMLFFVVGVWFVSDFRRRSR